jgi:ABC-type multidrug transport system fused ATPase/permease subunit
VRPSTFGGHISARGATGADLGIRRTMRRVSQLLRYIARHKLRAAIALVALLGSTATTIAGPVIAQQAIDRGIVPGDFGTVQFWVAVYLVVAAFGWGFTAVQSYLTTWVGERVLTDLRSDLFRHVQRLDLGYFERTRAGVVISRLTNDIEALNSLVTDGPTTLVQNTITLIGSALVLLYVDWRLALATLTVFPAMLVATMLYRHYSAMAYRRTRERLGEVTASLQEDISGVRVVQAFRREESNYRRFLEVNDHYREANQQTVTVSAIYFPFVDLLSATATAVVLGYGGVRALNGDITPGDLFVFIGLLANFFDPVQQLSQFYQTFLAGTAALDKVFEVLDTAPRMVDAPGARSCPTSTAALPSRTCTSPTAAIRRRCCTASPSPPSLGRRWRWSGTPVPASRRS